MSTPTKRSAGEELFLVHLRRQDEEHMDPEVDEDDHDHPAQRKRSRSIGEELFAVHLKRSEGCKPDYDVEEGALSDAAKEAEKDLSESAATEDVTGPEAMPVSQSEENGNVSQAPKENDAPGTSDRQ